MAILKIAMQRCGYFFNFQINFYFYLIDYQLFELFLGHRNPARLYAEIYTSYFQILNFQGSYLVPILSLQKNLKIA